MIQLDQNNFKTYINAALHRLSDSLAQNPKLSNQLHTIIGHLTTIRENGWGHFLSGFQSAWSALCEESTSEAPKAILMQLFVKMGAYIAVLDDPQMDEFLYEAIDRSLDFVIVSHIVGVHYGFVNVSKEQEVPEKMVRGLLTSLGFHLPQKTKHGERV